jgi:YD repeat-containing protein
LRLDRASSNRNATRNGPCEQANGAGTCARLTTYVYDADGDSDLDRIEQPAVPLAEGGSAQPVARFEHNARGQLTEITDPAGRITRLGYDAATGELTSTTVDPNGLALSSGYGYDSVGNRTSETDPRGNTTTLAYDAARQVLRITAPLGAVTEYDYDAHGRAIEERRATGDSAAPWQRVNLSYSATGKLAAISDDQGDTTSYSYDALDRQSHRTDPLGEITDYSYDAGGRLTLVQQPGVGGSRPEIACGYNAHGTRASVTDQNSHTTAYGYDGFDRHVLTTFPDGSSEALVLDGAGNLLSRTSRGSETFTYAYDALDRLDTKKGPGSIFCET